MKNRVIALLDINSCYASIAIQQNPSLRGKPVAVTGATEKRCGIVLAANREAKLCGVKTGMINRDAKAVCPDLVQVAPDFYQYQRYSRYVQEIYERYGPTEMFSIDEGWIDLSPIVKTVEEGGQMARKIADDVLFETGLTISIGVADNKVTAKLGSEYTPHGSKYKLPGTITAIPPEKYKEMCYHLAADELLGIGRRMGPQLANYGLYTIGDLAEADEGFIARRFGKVGRILQMRARGIDFSPVVPGCTHAPEIRSFGNSTTTPFDLKSVEEVWAVIYNMSDAVATRLRRHGFRARLVEVSYRNSDLDWGMMQHKFLHSTDVSLDIARQAMELFCKKNRGKLAVRAIGVRAGELVPSWYPEQTDLFTDPVQDQRRSAVEHTVDDIRSRFGYLTLQRAVMLTADRRLVIDAAGQHTVHPHSFM